MYLGSVLINQAPISDARHLPCAINVQCELADAGGIQEVGSEGVAQATEDSERYWNRKIPREKK